MPFVRHLGKTNMLTHIPEDIKLELKDGVLTLKAGSKVYVPNGAGKFDEVIIASDITNSTTGSAQMFLHITSGGTGLFAGYMTGGTVTERPSSPINYATYYNTTTNICEAYWDGTWHTLSFPIATATRGSSGYESIDQVFDGFGYIGSTVFVLPDVKGLIPDGRNADGSLKNIEAVTKEVTIKTSTSAFNFDLALYPNGLVNTTNIANTLKDEENNYYYTGSTRLQSMSMGVGSFTTNGVITSFTPKKVGEGIVKNKLYSLARRKRTYYKYGTEPNVTVVGSPTISNGVVSGFTTGNYLTLPQSFSNSNFEMVFKATAGNTSSDFQAIIGYGPQGLFLGLNKDNSIHFNVGSSGTWASGLNSSFAIPQGQTFYLKATRNGTTCTCDYSTDGDSWQNVGSLTTDLTNNQVPTIGIRSDGSQVFLGSIDLTQSYIKINGEDWWRGTKVVESTSTDYDYYKDNLVPYSPIVRGSRTYYKQSEKQRNTGTYTFTLDKDYTAKMLFVGNGGGGGSAETYGAWFQSCGGSGACFQGRVRLPKGTYTLTIGTLGYGYNIDNSQNYTGGVDSTDSFLKDSNGNELIRVGCGVRGQTAKTGAAGGTLTLGTLDIVETIIAKNGNQGHLDDPNNWSSTNAYALSAYDNTRNGYGAGTGSWYGGGNVYGVAGIFDLLLETNANDYEWYVDVATKIY